MTVLPLLPLCRQPSSARQQILTGLRYLIRHAKQLDLTLPRIRIRSLDIIPLSLSLPRTSPLKNITNIVDSSAHATSWLSLGPDNPLATALLPHILAFYDPTNRKPPPSLPPMITWNPTSLATIHTTHSPKLSHILKLARRHICHIQETQWSSVQYKHLQLQTPNCYIFHTPAVDGFSSGVATFLPKSYFANTSLTIVPGFILSVTVTIQQLQVEYINVYLHPSKVRPLGQALLTHLQTTTSRSHALRIIGGDFNHIQKSSTSLFQDILHELDSPLPPLSPTFRKHDGYTSCLDFFLIQSCATLFPLSSTALTFWPSYQPVGHGIHLCKPSKPTRISPCPDDLPASAIPSSVFYLPPSAQDTSPSLAPRDLLPLTRSLLRLQSPALLDIKAHFWTWWRHRKHPGTLHKTDSHHLHILKKLISNPTSLILTVPRSSWEWLLHQFPSDSFPAIFAHDHHAIVPLMLLSKLLIQYDAQQASLPSNRNQTQFSVPPTHTWRKCRIAAPKTSPHHGVVRSSTGTPCTTTATLDQALRATRHFWQEPPSAHDPQWESLLSTYSTQCDPFPPCPPPSHTSLYHAVITSPDSAPGADGIPYSAWRICPRITAQALDNHLQCILTRTASPPLQSLVFIPKADQGEYADNYRPLGLPNTCDRILDRSIYSPFSHCLLGALHPAQALLNLFREPQFNYLDIQHFLDNAMHLHSVLLSDLAKAFERVNPHWIMHVLVARATPYWILTYCRHILFGRKVLHKIKSHFRPPLAIHNGVDMGRAFSVLLFCVAMDPWYHYVHRIPRVLTNRGYMDDNATGGLGLQWLPEAQNLINRFSTAGLLVLTHSCYTLELLSSTPFTLPHYEILPHVTSGLPSLFQAYSSLPLTGLIRLRSGNRAVTLHSSSLRFGNTLTCPSHPDVLTFLHTAPCNCKCKTFLIPNHRLSPEELTYVDATPFGCKIIAPSATMLGLFLHSPLTYVLPSLVAPYHQSPQVHHFDVAAIETQQTSNALVRMTKRVQIGTRLALCFRERTIFLTFYVLSLPMYHHSILLPSTTLLAKYYGMIRSMLAPRPWVQAKHLPGIVSYLRLGILHCPSIHLYSSFLGYCLRCYGEPIAAWLCALTPTLPPLPRQLVLGLHAVQSALIASNPFNPEPFSDSFQRFIFAGLKHSTLSHKLTSLLKRHLTRRLFHQTRNFLRQRNAQVPWAWHSTPALFDALHCTPTKAIPSFARLAIVRWYLDTEPDVHFRLRPYLTRRTPCRCGCGVLTSYYPEGLRAGAVAPSHLSPLYTWRILSLPDTPVVFERFLSSPPHPSLPPPHCPSWTPRGQPPSPHLDFLSAPLRKLLDCPCILCNLGDNSVQHWLLFCPVIALAGSQLLKRPWTTKSWFFTSSSPLSQRAILAGLWVASRQLCHERSGLPPPSLDPPPVYSSSPFHLASLLVDRALALIPAPFRPSHIKQTIPLTIAPGCFRDSITFRTLTIELEGHPQYHGLVPTIPTAIPADHPIAILPMRSPVPKRLFAFQNTVPSPPNCTLQFRLCSCGVIHGYLISLTPIAPHSPLHVGDPVTRDSDFVLHFDGGAFRDLGVGGAGAILWLHNQGRLQLLSSYCIPLLPCIDAAYAEAAGAAYAVLLAGRYLSTHTPNKIIIKGDNRPVIDFMSNTGKYRRTDLQQLLEGAQHTLAFSLPHVLWSYTPREFNRCADYLAGVARDYARDAKSSSPSQASSLEPFSFSLPPSLATLYSPPSPLTLNVVSPSFTFPEVISLPTTHLPLVFQHAKHQPQVLKYLRALVQGTKYLPSLAITYRPTSPDRKGRLYPSPLGAQRLPRAIRTLLFGSTHYEIDLIGSHYQLFQKFALSLLQIPLPSIQDLRSLLHTDMEVPPCRVLELSPTAVKDLPTFLLNTTLDTILLHYRSLGYWPSTPIYNILQTIVRTKPRLFQALDDRFGARHPSNPTPANHGFHTLEHPETLWLKKFTSCLCDHHPIASLIWLHDGIWLSPLPPLEAIAAANRHASAHIGLSSAPLEFRITSCRPSYIDVLTPLLRGGPLPPRYTLPAHASPPYTSPPLCRTARSRVLYTDDAS